LGAHTLRLRPREGHDQRIESSTLTIAPAAELKWYRDGESNSVAIARFTESTCQLTIDCNSVVRKFDISPQDFLIDDYAVNYPFSYAAEDRLTLSPYTQCGGKTDCSTLKKWFAKVLSPVQSIQTF
ncbi:transglutaminase N-terminal domain-containing protein, partial [Alteromonas sp. 1_MG-2023]|uniref:transglutaminase N-terminal domain-containing protein n=1 Tax=Alteromonas sp. 1_MG-2023 TaxID=3062669 RepID=UPI0026E3F741